MAEVNTDIGRVLEALNGKVDSGFGNVPGNSVGFAKYSTEVTNCITYIPQDVKLELNNGTLTLKAGSKVYIPNGKNADGSLKFDELVIESDIAYNASSFTGRRTACLYYNRTNLVTQYTETECFSGSSSPTAKQYMLWYDTTNNLLKSTNNTGSTWSAGCSLPICIIDGSSAIDQVFNGFGYIGSTVFAFPGVKGLVPNGRNEDGSLKNIEYTQNTVAVYTASSGASGAYNMNSQMNGAIYPLDCYYDNSDNIIKLPNGELGTYQYIFGTITFQSGVITSFQPKTTFHALDWNDKETVVGWGMPDYSAAISITAPFTAPRDGIVIVSQKWKKTNVYTQVNGYTFVKQLNASDAGQQSAGTIIVNKGDKITTNGSWESGTFIPMKGVN